MRNSSGETNPNTSAYYKLEGTTLYVMTIIKSDKIHSDGVKTGETTYGWWNGIASELYMTYNGTIYNIGSHIYQGKYANAITWGNNATLVNSADSVRSYMALGTFDNDEDTDRGCILLNTYDLIDIEVTSLTGVKVTFSGFVGPNDGGDEFVIIDASKSYTF